MGHKSIDLGKLPPRGAGAGAEVRPIPRQVARLPWPATPVATDRLVEDEPLDPQPERLARWYIFKCLLCRRDRVANICGIAEDLRELAASHIGIRTERAVGIAVDNSSAGQTAHIGIEGICGIHVTKLDRTRCSSNGGRVCRRPRWDDCRCAGYGRRGRSARRTGMGAGSHKSGCISRYRSGCGYWWIGRGAVGGWCQCTDRRDG